jgi:hypothetical protein
VDRSMRRMLFVTVMLAFAVPAAAAAQQTPEQVVSAYFGHVARGEMRQAARLTHPEALDAFRDHVARQRAGGGEYGYAINAFPRGTDVRRLPADSVLAALLATFQDREEILAALRAEPLGHVMDGDRALVVTQVSIGDEDEFIRYPLVITLRRDGRAWKLDPGREFADVLGGGALYVLGIHEFREDIAN